MHARGSSPCNRIESIAPMKNNKLLNLALVAACALASGATMAQKSEGPWLVRARAVNLASANKDFTGLGLSINDKVIPEVDVSYFFTKNIAAELVLTVPQKHDVNATALNGKIGTLKHLPPSLLLQYHFDAPGFKPYVGAGLNYTRFSSVHLPAGVGIDKSSWGGALQVGVDIPLSKNLVLNLDVKKVYIQADVFAGGAKAGTFKVDPVLVGIGLGYRF